MTWISRTSGTGCASYGKPFLLYFSRCFLMPSIDEPQKSSGACGWMCGNVLNVTQACATPQLSREEL